MKRKLVVFLCALSLIGLTNAQEASETSSVASITIGANTIEYDTLDAAITAAQSGNTITLSRDVQMTADKGVEISGKTVTIDLNQKCLTFPSKITGNRFSFTNGAKTTFKNGTIDISNVQGDANAIFQVSDSAQMAFESVTLTGKDYTSPYAVLYANGMCTGDPAIALKGCTVTLENEKSVEKGGFLKAENTAAKFLISGCSITLTNPVRGIVQGDVTIENSSLTITGEGTKETLDNGINSSNLTVKNSTIAISNGSGRGLTLDGSNTVSIDAKSTVTISAMDEGAVMFRDITEGAKLTVDGTLKMDQAIVIVFVNVKPSIDTDKVVSGSGQIINTSLVAQIGATAYTTLAAAVDAVPTDGTQTTIVLLQDCTGSGVKVAANKNIVFDLNGKTYTVTNPVGSSGTETNGFQLLKGATVTFQNGRIESASAKILIQNYCNLTLDGVTLNAKKNAQIQYTLSNNFGQVTVTGKTKIYASAGQVAFDLYYWPKGGYGEGVSVTFDADFTGQVEGKIEYARDNTTTDEICAEKAILTVAEGAQGLFDVTFSTSVQKANIQLKGGRYTTDPSTYCPAGYTATETTVEGQTLWAVQPAVAQIGETTYETLAEAVAAAPADGTETTITLLGSFEGNGAVVKAGQNIVFDLSGETYTVTGLVGSSGTETQAFQLLKGAKVTFKNGTLESATALVMVQNYADLTLENVKVNTQKSSRISYVISNNCGSLTVKGETEVIAADGKVAFDLYYWPSGGYPEGVAVTFAADFCGQVVGKVEYAADGTATEGWQDEVPLTVEAGCTGTFALDLSAIPTGAKVAFKGGFFTADVGAYCAKGYAAYVATTSETALWQVLPEGSAVAAVSSSEATYATLEAALYAAQSGDTVTLLQDVALADKKDKKSVLVVGKGTPEAPLTLDFNGHFMKGNNSSTASTASASSASSGILAVAQSHVVLTDSSTGAKGGVRNTYTKSGTTTSYYAAVLVTTAYKKDGTTTYADASAVIQGGIHLEVPDAGITGCAVRQYHSETKGGTNKVEIIDAETQISGVVVCKTEGAGATCEIKGGRFTSTCASARTVAKDTHHTDENGIVYDIKVSGGEFTNHYVPQSDFPILSGDVVMELTKGGQLHWTVGQPVPDAATMTVETLPSGYKSAEGVQIAVQGNAPFACLDAFNLFRSGVGVRINETVAESCSSLSFGAKAQMQTLEITVAQGKTLTFTEALPLYRATITVKGEGTFSAESLKPLTEAYELTTPAAAEGTTLYVCDVKDDALVATWTKADGSVNKYASVDDFGSFGRETESTFKLYQDVEISLGVTTSSKWNVSSGRKLTLDLNGHTLSLLSSSKGKGYHYILLNKGTLAITNSDTTRLGTLVSANTETAAIVVKGSTSATATDYSVLSIGEHVLVKGTSAVLIDRYSSAYAKNYGTKVSIAGALEGIDDAAGNPGSALYLNGTLEATTDAIPEVTLTSTARVSSSGVGIYAAGYGKWSVADDAQISGALTGIEIRAGQLTVNGGTITSTASSYSVEPNDNGTTTVGAGIAVAQHTTNLPLKVTVKGGEISGYVALSEANPEGNDAEALKKILDIRGGTFKAQSAAVVSADCTRFISGGYFSNAVPLAYCATGKVPKTLTEGETGYMAEAPYTVEPTSENFVAVNADGSAEVYKTLANVPDQTPIYIAPSAEKDAAVAAALASAKATTGPADDLKDATEGTELTVKEVAEVLGGAFTVKQVKDAQGQTTETKLVYHYNFGVAGLEVRKQAETDELALTVVAKLTEGELPANRTLVGRTLQVVLEKGDRTPAKTYSVANPVFNEKGECRVPVPWSAMTTGTNSIKVKVVK